MKTIETQKYVSSTELKAHTKDTLDQLEKDGEIFIMSNNKPRAILLSIKQYNDFMQHYHPVIGDEIIMTKEEEDTLLNAQERINSGEYINEEDFFNTLK